MPKKQKPTEPETAPVSEKKRRRLLRLEVKRRNDPFAEFTEQLSPGAREVLTHFGRSTEAKTRKWYLVEIPDFGSAQLHEYVTFAEVRGKLAELDGQAVTAMVFFGARAYLTKNSPRRVLHPNGAIYPLHPDSDEIIIDNDGYMGEASEEFDDDGEQVMTYAADEDDED